MVRIEPGRLQDVEREVPGSRRVRPGDLPSVVRVTQDLQTAEQTAERLRAAGAVAIVLGAPSGSEGAFCEHHPSRIAARLCVSCGAPLCTSCRKQALGDEVCPPCWIKGRGRHRRTRLRQLFAIFIFAAFLHQVLNWVKEDRASVGQDRPTHVAIFQFVSPEDAGATLIRQLNGLPTESGEGTTLRDIEGWYDTEFKRYTGRSDALTIDVLGPWGRNVDPPPIDADSVWESAWNAFNSVRYFHNLARDQGVEPDDYAVRIYVVYSTDPQDLAAHSRGSETGHVAIAYVDLEEQNPGYAVMTVAHELGHTLGAADLYDPDTYLSRYPEGYVQPYVVPLYPQRWAEIMAVDRPLSPSSEQELRSLSEARIGYATAAALNWIPQELARVHYRPPEETPAMRLAEEVE